MDAFYFWLEVVGIGSATGMVMLWCVFLVLMAREQNFQKGQERELAQERLTFHQPKWEIVDDAGFLFGKSMLYALTENFVVHWNGRRWLVPEGYHTDGASVPRFFWTITGYLPDGRHRAAAVAHDFLCDKRPSWSNWLDAAECFAHYQRLARVRPAKIVATKWAVILFGPKWLRKGKGTRPGSRS